MRGRLLLAGLLVLFCTTIWAEAAANRDALQEGVALMNQGNRAEAYDLLRTLSLDPETTPQVVDEAVRRAVSCLDSLGRHAEFDPYIERVVEAHPGSWRVLYRAGREYIDANHMGFMIAGEFRRGGHRGGGERVWCYERDRVRAIQLMRDAEQLLLEADEPPATVGSFYQHFANVIKGQTAWRLQILTDLSELPDYERQYPFSRGQQGAPAHPDGTPIFYHVGESWDDVANDGERWRWALVQAVEHAPQLRDQIQLDFAQFLQGQFGVQTLRQYSGWRVPDADETSRDSIYTLHTLGESETIARLATGVARFELPDEFNHVVILKEIGGRARDTWAQTASERLAQIYENRRQFARAAEQWRAVIERFGPGNNNYRKDRLNQIVGNWGQFEPVMTQPADSGATVDFRFRNATEVKLTARRIDREKLLQDVREYLESEPRKIDWQKIHIENLGYQIFDKERKKYIGEEVADWKVELDPAHDHFDRRITITTPLQKAGAYLLTAELDDGNRTDLVLWVSDTAIIRKRMDNRELWIVTNARDGQPLEGIQVDFFGYRTETSENPAFGRRFEVMTDAHAARTDVDGKVITSKDTVPSNWQWLVTATDGKGRLAHYGFSHVWYGARSQQNYNRSRVYLVTDRPVYRPEQKVEFRFWAREMRYDLPTDASTYANTRFTVRIHSPRNEKVFEESVTTDAFGGGTASFSLPADAVLGNYRIEVRGTVSGNQTFRVEEYKKPEFEVTIDAPDKPAALGESLKIKVRADYYFGAPVLNAKVKYKVTRQGQETDWVPWGPWEWLYGRGYGWYGVMANWHHADSGWVIHPPRPWWFPVRRDPPELIAENEVPIGPDGTIEIEVDTRLALELHPDLDHRYTVSAEVTDESRRTIVGTGSVMVARDPFRVYAWMDRGHYRVGQTINALATAQQPGGKKIEVKSATVRLMRLADTWEDERPASLVEEWTVNPEAGELGQKITASQAGQYRVEWDITDSEDRTRKGVALFNVYGDQIDGSAWQFNALEIVPEKRTYAVGENIRFRVNTARTDGTVFLFVRPENGVYPEPQVLRLDGRSTLIELPVAQGDMPNFFVEAVTVSEARVHTETREICVPPESRVLDVEVVSDAEEYLPGAEAELTLRVTDETGEPVGGSLVLTVYDEAVEYISGGSNAPDIREFFWKWRRRHNPATTTNLERWTRAINAPGAEPLRAIGVFGHMLAVGDELVEEEKMSFADDLGGRMSKSGVAMDGSVAMAAPVARNEGMVQSEVAVQEPAEAAPEMAEPTVRTEFADTAYWSGDLVAGEDGIVKVNFKMPENLTGWKIRTWVIAPGTRVGQGEAKVVTRKNLMLRMQAPRFFVEKDEVVLSANVHNYLDHEKQVRVRLALDGDALENMTELEETITIPAGGEQRVDWRVRALNEGEAVVRMAALTDEESDAMEMRFPVRVHGMLKTDSWSGAIRPDGTSQTITIRVPEERRPAQTRLEVRYSPTLAGAMVDALPYLVDYPYGCTEQTLSRFLPAVLTQNTLKTMGVDLQAVREKQTNLNAQEIGDDAERAAQWERENWRHNRQGQSVPENPVWEEETVADMVAVGIRRLESMQVSDGGWGWFSGYGEYSYPHTTAWVVHGLQVGIENGVELPEDMLQRGIDWLSNYQKQQISLIENYGKKDVRQKRYADNQDAFIYMVLGDAGQFDGQMREYLYRDRNHLAVYAKALFALALDKEERLDERDMLIRNVEQYLKEDPENQTAWLELPNSGYWWYWYGSEWEAHAAYLKLLARVAPKSERAAGLVKYLLNNRKHATYWNSTRDTALVVEAFADYLKATDEMRPDMTVHVMLDGEEQKSVRITPENVFWFDNQFLTGGPGLSDGEHTVSLVREGEGPLYFNAYLTNFTLEDPITSAGLEVKIERNLYRLTREEASAVVQGGRGQAVEQQVEKYRREPIENLDALESGDLVEIELVVHSKNDYEYLMIQDPKAAGFEPVEVRSGYNGNAMGAYMELRDEQVTFFCRRIARGTHSLSYRMRAEIPGHFSALPTRILGMYAPELKGNSNEAKVRIVDAPVAK